MRKPDPTLRAAAFNALHEAGWSTDDILKAFGCSHYTVLDITKPWRLEAARNERIAEEKELANVRVSEAEVERFAWLSVRTSRIIRENGIKTFGELQERLPELTEAYGFGKKCKREVEEVLASLDMNGPAADLIWSPKIDFFV